MDLVVHFPTGDIKRNLEQNDTTKVCLTQALGTSSWVSKVSSMTDIGGLIEGVSSPSIHEYVILS